MKLGITPTYSDIFDGPLPNFKELIEDIPSSAILKILSLLNAELYLDKSLNTQSKLLRLLIRRQSTQIQQQIIKNASRKVSSDRKDDIYFFSVLLNLEFIHLELLNFRDFKIPDTTPLQELNFLKAYLIISERINKKYSDSFDVSSNIEGEFFQKYTWPVLIDQFEANQTVDPIQAMIKGIAFLNYLEYKTKYTLYVKNFLKINEKETSWNYILDLTNILQHSWKPSEGEFPSFSFSESDGFKTLFANISINIDEYKSAYSKANKNYAGIKAKPLFKLDDQTYIVLNWNFIINKLYEGLLFDFYNYSGINNENNFADFANFKKFISEEVTEKYLFRRTLIKCLKEKNYLLEFDNQNDSGFPDSYFRKGKYIFLFEIKDAYFPSEAINSYSYESIKKSIDLKYNSNKKGTGQIIKQLQKLKLKPFEKKSYEQLGLKTRNLVIFPIIIYTDIFFGLPGINQYLITEFRERIKYEELDNTFGVIKDLTLINLSFFVNFISVLSHENNFHQLVDYYHEQIKKRTKKHLKEKSIENLFAINDNFETVILNSFENKFEERKNNITTIVDTLELTKNLPKE